MCVPTIQFIVPSDTKMKHDFTFTFYFEYHSNSLHRAIFSISTTVLFVLLWEILLCQLNACITQTLIVQPESGTSPSVIHQLMYTSGEWYITTILKFSEIISMFLCAISCRYDKIIVKGHLLLGCCCTSLWPLSWQIIE